MSTNFAQRNSNNNSGDPPSFLAHTSYSPATADEEDTLEERAYMQQLEEENLRELLARNRPAAYQRYGQHNNNNTSNDGSHTSSSRHHHRHQSSMVSGAPFGGGSVAATVTHTGLSSRSSNVYGEIKSTSSYNGYGLPLRPPQANAANAGNRTSQNNSNSNNSAIISNNTLLQYAGTGKFGVGLGGITVTAGSPLGCGENAFPSASASTTSSSCAPSPASPTPSPISSSLPPNRLLSVTAKIRERDQMREQQIGQRERPAHTAGSNAIDQPTTAQATQHTADGGMYRPKEVAQLGNSIDNDKSNTSSNTCSNGGAVVGDSKSAVDNLHPHNDSNKVVVGGDIVFSSSITSPHSQSISDPPPHVRTTRRQSLMTSPFTLPLPHTFSTLLSRDRSEAQDVGLSNPPLSNERGNVGTSKSSVERTEEIREQRGGGGQPFIALTEDNIRTLNISNSIMGAGTAAPATNNPPPHQRGTTFSTILHEFVNESLASAAGRELSTERSGGDELSSIRDNNPQAVDERGQRRSELWRMSSNALKRLFGKRGGEGAVTTTSSPANSPPLASTTANLGVNLGVGGLLSQPLQLLRTESGRSLSPTTHNGTASTPRGAGAEVDPMMAVAASGTLSSAATVVGRGDSNGRTSAAVTPRGVPWIRFPRSRMRAYFGDTPWESLHAQPTLVVGVLATAFIMICTYIMQHYVLEIKDHLGLFAMGSYVNFSSYYVVYFYLEKYSTSFRKISQDKKFYTISNIIKASMLAAITPFAVKHLYLIVVHDSWDTSTLRNLGCVYSIPDFVSLLVVRRMSNTTIFHHVCVVVFNYFSLRNDYGKENVCRCIVVYAAFSTFAYVVNMLLASRFLGVSGRVNRFLALVALAVYVFCCAVNWTWQVHYLRKLILNHDHWSIYMYMILICFVMWDDIVLNRWLLQNFKNTSGFSSSSASTALAHSSGGGGGGGGSNDMGLIGRRSRGNTVSNGQNATTTTTSLGVTSSTSNNPLVGLPRHTSSASLHSRSTQGGVMGGSTVPMMSRAASGNGQLAYRQYSANSQSLLTNRRASEQQPPSAGF